MDTDVLIIGSGLAGVSAALELIRSGVRQVTLATQSSLVQSNSAWAQGGIAAALGQDDRPELHAADTLEAGAGLCHPQAVEVLTREGVDRVRELMAMGVPFSSEPGLEGGHRRRRILHTPGSQTGKEIMAVLFPHLRQIAGQRLRILEHAELVALAMDEDRCHGAWFQRPASNGQSGLTCITAQATLLTTGGAAGLYPFSTSPPGALGSGIAVAYLAGALVADMEFLQFHPTALRRSDGRCMLISEAVRGEGAHLLNAAGERFMPAVHPMAELAPRDIVARAIVAEMQRLSGPVHLSLRHLSAKAMHTAFPFLSDICHEEGLDLARDLIPVAPAAHYLCGGVWTDLHGRSSLPGLWVAGEAACTGVQGANRLASNSLLECLVFGNRAAQDMLTHSADGLAPHGASTGLARLDASPAGNDRIDVSAPQVPPQPSATELQELRQAVSEHLGLVRNGTGMQQLLDWLSQQPATTPRLCADVMARGALLRTESRGCHWRSDAQPVAGEPVRIVQRHGQAPTAVPVTATPTSAAQVRSAQARPVAGLSA